jgi:hypothetical protein
MKKWLLGILVVGLVGSSFWFQHHVYAQREARMKDDVIRIAGMVYYAACMQTAIDLAQSLHMKADEQKLDPICQERAINFIAGATGGQEKK